MTDAGDAGLPDASALADEAPAPAPAETPDSDAARRTALRDLAAMIGVEVFY